MSTSVQRLVPLGDGFALVLDRETLERLQIDGKTLVSVSITGGTLTIARASGDERRKRFEDAKNDTFSKYDDVFRRLAE